MMKSIESVEVSATGSGLAPDPIRTTSRAYGYVLVGALAWQGGSGGNVNLEDLLRYSTGPATIAGSPATAPEDAAKSIGSRLALLRRWLSLSVSETAQVLHVTRPTIYAWQSGKMPAEETKQRRLQELYEVGRSWRDRSSAPIGTRRKLILANDERNLVSLLEAEPIDRAAVERLLSRVLEIPTRRRASEMAEEHGFGSLSPEEAAANIERESMSVGDDRA